MNIIKSTAKKTMSSREIAELTEKRHADVKRDIMVMSEQLEIDVRKFAHTYFDSQNREQGEFLLDQDTTLCLVSGYSAKLRMAIIKRWKQLEEGFYIPQTYGEALQLCADQAKQLEVAKPKIEYFDMVADVNNYMNATTVGQKVGMSATVLNKHLEGLDVYNRAIKTGRVFQQWFIDKGLGVMKKTDNGYNLSRFTNKGEQWVIQKLTSEGVI